MKKLKIWWLKRRMRAAYRHATAWKDYMDCGHGMAIIIDPRIPRFEQDFNRLADRLCELGEPIPTARYPK